MNLDNMEMLFEIKHDNSTTSKLLRQDNKHFLLIELPMLSNEEGHYQELDEEDAIRQIEQVFDNIKTQTDEANRDKNADYALDNMENVFTGVDNDDPLSGKQSGDY
tara:strand:- start:8740 stop:9057 length:318 start_codon:yes stop_codon:yes gene_type:complete